MTPLEKAIHAELLHALELSNVEPHLCEIVGSWGETLDDEEILELLKEWNRRRESGEPFHMRN